MHKQHALDLSTGKRAPIAVAYGMGVDSTAMLVGLHQRGIRPDIILFADTGAEKPETYAYEDVMQDWLAHVGFPPIETVRYVPKDFKNWPPYYTLEDNCLTNGTLPGISFGPATCSVKWKQQPQHTRLKQWRPATDAWSIGMRVTKLIGFDASPTDRRRTYTAGADEDRYYQFEYPLQAWGWDRAECQRQIAAAGLPVPVKSSCWFCLAMKPPEVAALQPDLLRRIVALEARAAPRLKSCEGLWRTEVKGTRGGTKRPGSMTKFIREQRLLPAEEIDAIIAATPQAILSFQAGWVEAGGNTSLPDYRHQRHPAAANLRAPQPEVTR